MVRPNPFDTQSQSAAIIDLASLRADRDKAMEEARLVIRDTTRLTRILTILSERAPLPVLLDRALSTLSELFSSDVVALLDPSGTGAFTPVAAIGLPEELLCLPLSDAADGPVASALRLGQPIFSNNAAHDLNVDPHLRALDINTAVWLPVITDHTPRGVLILARCRPVPFSHAEADLLMVMAQRIVQILEQAQLNAQFEQIALAGRHIACCLDDAPVGEGVVRRFPLIVRAHASALVLRDEHGALRCVSSLNLDPSWSPAAVRLAEHLLTRPPLAEGNPYGTADLQAEEFSPESPGGRKVRALLAAPIQRGGETWGALYAMRFSATHFPPSTLQAALLYAAQASMFLENAALYRSLRNELAERTRTEQELKLAKSLTDAANRSKSEFLANMSHEIRTPLTGIVGMLQLLETTSPSEEQQEYIAASIRSTHRLTRLLSDILDLSRIEAGKLVLQEVVFEIGNQKASVMEMFTSAARRKNLVLDFAIDERLPQKLIGDEARLRQILFNLVGNAIKFTNAGSVRIKAAPLPARSGAGLRVLFTVEDTGIGIPDAQIKDIFEPFTQVEGSYVRQNQGAGLGLSIVRRLVALMSGTLAIGDAESGGTTIYLCLPFQLPEAAHEATPVPLSGRTCQIDSRPRILLVEDDEVNRDSGARILEKSGYSVTSAQNGREALQRLAEQPFDLVLMDIQMPVMDGVEAMRRIRASTSMGDNSRIPIIAMTAYAMVGDKEKFLAAGMDEYIAKPVGIEALRALIERVMAGKK